MTSRCLPPCRDALERLAADDWQVWFYRAAPVGPAAGLPPAQCARPATPANGECTRDGDGEGAGGVAADGVVVLDVRHLEPPEPMLRTLAALDALPPGGTLVQVNARVPQFLLPQLAQRGFSYEIREQHPQLVRVFIRRTPADSDVTTQPSTGRGDAAGACASDGDAAPRRED